MKIDIDYDALDGIVVATLLDSYDMLYREVKDERQRIADCPFNAGHILENIERNNEILDAIRILLSYYEREEVAEEKIRSIEAAINKERDLERYSKMFKNMRA